MPFRGEFNPVQKAWSLYIILIMMPLLSLTGVLLLFGKESLGPALFDRTMVTHLGVAMATDLLLFVHVYIKYFRKWGTFCIELISTFLKHGHLFYPFAHEDSRLGPCHARQPVKAE
jgi:thiosulfate reductase cytochrome b subunit